MARAIAVFTLALSLSACASIAPVDRDPTVEIVSSRRRTTPSVADARLLGFPPDANVQEESTPHTLRTRLVSHADKLALVRIACLPGRKVEIGDQWRLIDYRIAEGVLGGCPVQDGEDELSGTVRIRQAGGEPYTWEIVIELEVPPGVSPADMDRLIESVRGIATQMRRVVVAPSAPAELLAQADCVAACGSDQTCKANCSNAYHPAAAPSDDHSAEIVGGVLLVLAITAGVATLIGGTVDVVTKLFGGRGP